MLYWKYSANRVFFLNEYWILMPTMALVDYVIIRQIRCHKEKIELLKKLKAQIEREKKLRRILLFSLGLNGCTYLLTRGGADLINTDHILCGIEEGLRYLDDQGLNKIIHNLYRSKRKGKVIYITATAVCHLAKRYGKTVLNVPWPIMGHVGVTSLYQTVRKVVVTVLLGGVAPLWIAGGPVALATAFTLLVLGLRVAVVDLDSIPTNPVPEMDSVVVPRKPNEPEVVVINNRKRNEIIMSKPENKECWLPDQQYLNSNCQLKSTEIPNAIDVNYEEVVNMQDVTGLDRVDFTDVLDLGQPESSTTTPKFTQGKEVNFLDKFGDSGTINEEDTWDVTESPIPEKRYLRTRNEL